MLTKDQISAAKDRPREFVPIKEWTPEGETFDPTKHGVYVSTMTARENGAWELGLHRDKSDPKQDDANLRAKLAVLCVQNEDGSKTFEPADAEWLGEKAHGPLVKIFSVAVRLNQLHGDKGE